MALGIDEELVWRHPFPGPGLAIRIIGDITRERVALLQVRKPLLIWDMAISLFLVISVSVEWWIKKSLSYYFIIAIILTFTLQPPSPLPSLQLADDIMIQEITAAGIYREIGQAFVVLLPVKSVGVMGDQRTYEQACAIRCVTSADFMTADWYVDMD